MMKHGSKYFCGTTVLRLDTKDDRWYVLTTEDGEPIARQTKQSHGKRFQQAGTNPDYTGFDAYTLERKEPGSDTSWHTYASDANKRDMVSTTFLDRLAEVHGFGKRPVLHQVFVSCKASLEDHQAQTGARITPKLVRATVDNCAPVFDPRERKAVVEQLIDVLCNLKPR